MNRRQFLTLPPVAVGVSGCLGSLSPPSADDAETESRPPTGTVDRYISLVGVTAVDSSLAVRVTVEVTEPVANDEHPPRIRVTTENRGEKRVLSVGTDGCDPFNRGKGRSEDGGLWLYREGHTPDEREQGRWEFAGDPDEPLGWPSYGCGWRTYDRGEATTTVYEVWDDYRMPGYMRPGTYRFGTWQAVAPAGSDLDTDGRSFVVGFTLRVERP